MRQVYLDYSATTPVKEEVWKAMLPYYTDFYGNPSSLYSVGLEAKAGVDKARKQVADLINAEEREITFTSCGTEADNWVLEGVADKLKEKGRHIITSKIEHHAILHTCEYLEKHGLTDLMKVVGGVPPLHTPYVPRNSIVREFVGGSCYQY